MVKALSAEAIRTLTSRDSSFIIERERDAESVWLVLVQSNYRKEDAVVRPMYMMRAGRVIGSKHAQLRLGNQDNMLVAEFAVPAWKRTYRVGLVSDGCSGVPAFSRTEVISGLLVPFCFARIQELIAGGTGMEEIPARLYQAVINFLRDLANTVMPSTVYWPYPVTFKGENAFRNNLSATQRFITDYLMATIVGFIDDGETLTTFQAGDGVVIVDNEIHITDQNNQPEYPALAINAPGNGFAVRTYESAAVQRLVIATDGLVKVLAEPATGLPGVLFTHLPNQTQGLQMLLGILYNLYEGLLGDDCAVVTRLRINQEATP